jgi:hypothetical protein
MFCRQAFRATVCVSTQKTLNVIDFLDSGTKFKTWIPGSIEIGRKRLAPKNTKQGNSKYYVCMRNYFRCDVYVGLLIDKFDVSFTDLAHPYHVF